ncbi:adenosylhomocysteinase [Halanaerobium hydrogeniformans]|uniref:Adenosylhomocysteinase n=1 Tax=Halanaerobium hydrogeniformans TaxID=656519 RepID=E4RJU1_HALHG|nr:adenosylhomocysteinase [Halanaerobium hydrogeniformans]ADQ15511.1 adenosylhomocysteinase [Halanaerobium hydrogeniformans]
MIENSTLRNPDLAAEGWKKIEWIADKMDILNQILKEYQEEQPFAGKNVAICLHLEAKTAYLAYVIKELGAEVAICGSNPLSTQDDVAAGLAAHGVEVHSWYGSTSEEYKVHLNKVLDTEPDFIIDDGGDMVEALHTERKELLQKIIGGAEETTTGIHRLEAMEADGTLSFPMMAVNDAQCKSLFDNRYGTGQSVWDGIMRTTNLVVAGKTAVVAGYGWCGKGVAMRAKGLGARVIVTEIDPIKASEAWMDGFEVMPMKEAAKKGDFFITVTGCNDVIAKEHIKEMKDGAILSNAGHFDVEVSKTDLKELAVDTAEARKNIKKYEMADQRKIYLLAEGRLVNLAAADGHPAEIMDMTFALQLSSLLYLNKNQDLANKVYKIPDKIDNMVAEYKLKSLGIKIDKLTEAQKDYISSWETN